MEIESIVNELVEKRIREKVAEFLDGDPEREPWDSRASSSIDPIWNEKISEMITLSIEKNKDALKRTIEEAIRKKVTGFGDHARLKIHITSDKY